MAMMISPMGGADINSNPLENKERGISHSYAVFDQEWSLPTCTNFLASWLQVYFIRYFSQPWLMIIQLLIALAEIVLAMVSKMIDTTTRMQMQQNGSFSSRVKCYNKHKEYYTSFLPSLWWHHWKKHLLHRSDSI